ncbi:MAG: hypothetical protein ACW986_05125 [Promethearchaeota archaeon]
MSEDLEFRAEGKVKFKEIPGGMYAVTRCKGVHKIHATWLYLFNN